MDSDTDSKGSESGDQDKKRKRTSWAKNRIKVKETLASLGINVGKGCFSSTGGDTPENKRLPETPDNSTVKLKKLEIRLRRIDEKSCRRKIDDSPKAFLKNYKIPLKRNVGRPKGSKKNFENIPEKRNVGRKEGSKEDDRNVSKDNSSKSHIVEELSNKEVDVNEGVSREDKNDLLKINESVENVNRMSQTFPELKKLVINLERCDTKCGKQIDAPSLDERLNNDPKEISAIQVEQPIKDINPGGGNDGINGNDENKEEVKSGPEEVLATQVEQSLNDVSPDGSSYNNRLGINANDGNKEDSEIAPREELSKDEENLIDDKSSDGKNIASTGNGADLNKEDSQDSPARGLAGEMNIVPSINKTSGNEEKDCNQAINSSNSGIFEESQSSVNQSSIPAVVDSTEFDLRKYLNEKARSDLGEKSAVKDKNLRRSKNKFRRKKNFIQLKQNFRFDFLNKNQASYNVNSKRSQKNSDQSNDQRCERHTANPEFRIASSETPNPEIFTAVSTSRAFPKNGVLPLMELDLDETSTVRVNPAQMQQFTFSQPPPLLVNPLQLQQPPPGLNFGYEGNFGSFNAHKPLVDGFNNFSFNSKGSQNFLRPPFEAPLFEDPPCAMDVRPLIATFNKPSSPGSETSSFSNNSLPGSENSNSRNPLVTASVRPSKVNKAPQSSDSSSGGLKNSLFLGFPSRFLPRNPPSTVNKSNVVPPKQNMGDFKSNFVFNNSSVIILNFPTDVTIAELQEICSRFGKTSEVKVNPVGNYACLRFELQSSAEAFLKNYHKKKIGSNIVDVLVC